MWSMKKIEILREEKSECSEKKENGKRVESD